MSRRHKLKRWRVDMVAGVIRQIRGRPLLEALFNLQKGRCAYDQGPCALLLPPTSELVGMGFRLPEEVFWRLATIDHVTPRAKGGTNTLENYMMASKIMNTRKADLEPIGQWAPRFKRRNERAVAQALREVEVQRESEAREIARIVNNKTDARKLLVNLELEKLQDSPVIEFYSSRYKMVA